MDQVALTEFLARDFGQVAVEFVVKQVGPDGLALRLKVVDRHLLPGGTVSGPSIYALADVAMYLAILARIGPVSLAVTTNCAIDFLRKPAAECDPLGEARVLKLGRTLAVGDVMVFCESVAKPVARASVTYAIPQGEVKGPSPLP